MMQSVTMAVKSEILKRLCGPDPRTPASTGTASVAAGLGGWESLGGPTHPG